MRSLKECYEIAKQYHMYWNHDKSEYFMCVAALHAAEDGALTGSEAVLIEQDAMSLVKALDHSAESLRHALRDVDEESLADHDRVKAYWDKYIDSMENQMGEDFDYEDYPIPDWAIGSCNGAYVIGAQLPTRDGRRCGNAHIIDIEPARWDKSVLVHIVLTDAGTTIKLTRIELEELFYSPMWISPVKEVIRKFGNKE